MAIKNFDHTIHHYLEKMNDLLTSPKLSFKKPEMEIPENPGIYAIYDTERKLPIYVGRTKNLNDRLLHDHRQGNIRGSQFRKALERG